MYLKGSYEPSKSSSGVGDIQLSAYAEVIQEWDRMCGLVVRVPGCRPRGLGFDFRRYQIFCVAVCLGRGSLSIVKIYEELFEIKSAAPV
jgi:hypothetical protein